MAFPEVELGIYPGLGGTQRLTRRLGRGLARYLLFTGVVLDAPLLEQLKLAWKVVRPEEVDATVRAAISSAPVQETITVEQAPDHLKDIGHFLAAVPAEGLLDGTLTLPGGSGIVEVARVVRRKSPHAIRAVAALTDLAEHESLDAGLSAETEGLRTILTTDEAIAGAGAKRARSAIRLDNE
jgi:enoyl-CoA hydratase/carnithine racemase